MPGGDLHWIWAPYATYVNIDYIYGWPSVQSFDGFPKAQSMMNIIETVLNFAYLYLAHVDASIEALSIAPVVGLVAVVMTASKTVLYLFNDWFCGPNGWCKTGHNSLFNFIFLWFIPNTPWIFIPTAISYVLGSQIADNLLVAAKVAAGGAKGAGVQKKKTR